MMRNLMAAPAIVDPATGRVATTKGEVVAVQAPPPGFAHRRWPHHRRGGGRMNGLGQFEFVDPGYGFELAATDIGMDFADFAFDPLAFDLGIADFGIDFGTDFANFGTDASAYDWGFDADWGADFPSTSGFEFSMPDVNIADITNLVKTGFSVYQAYEQLTNQPPQQQTLTRTTAPTGTTATRTAASYLPQQGGVQYTVDPRTGQIVPVMPQQQTASQDLIPGVPNWALLAGAAGIGALFLMGGKRRR